MSAPVDLAGNSIESTDPTANLAVSETEYLDAVKDLLTKVNIPLDLNQETLMSEILSLRAKLTSTEENLRDSRVNESKYRTQLEEATQGNTCPICKEEEVSICLVPCGHMTCETCAEAWKNRTNVVQCPFCRRELMQLVKMYKP